MFPYFIILVVEVVVGIERYRDSLKELQHVQRDSVYVYSVSNSAGSAGTSWF